MVSWSDETSEDSVLNISSSCDGIIKLLATMHDPNFNGTNADVNVLCEHDSMEKALAKLWDMYEDIKSARTNDNLESSFAIHNLTEEKNKLQENYDKEEEKKMLQNYETLKNLTCAQANVIRNLKFNRLKEKERLTEERLKLNCQISELQKSEEKIKLKLQGVKAILDE
ncbi:hypothetical protein VPH35_106698 [Triticum aestivum]